MKRLRLSDFSTLKLKDLKKMDNKYFKKYGVVKMPENANYRNLEYFVHRVYESLPKKERRYIEPERRLVIRQTINTVYVSGDKSEMNVYNSLIERINSVKKDKGVGTAEFVFKLFKEQRRSVYNKYNTYVYRLGHSSSEWFIDNFEYTVSGAMLYAHIELPIKLKGRKIYKELYIEALMSGEGMMQEAIML